MSNVRFGVRRLSLMRTMQSTGTRVPVLMPVPWSDEASCWSEARTLYTASMLSMASIGSPLNWMVPPCCRMNFLLEIIGCMLNRKSPSAIS